MADSPSVISTLNGWYKTVYASKEKELVPNFALLEKKPFAQANKTGNYFAMPVALTHEHGFSYLGTAGTSTASLNDSVPAEMKEAQVYGNELILRAHVGYAALSRAGGGGAQSFGPVLPFKIKNMKEAMHKRLEIARLYGQKGIAVVDTVPSSTTFTVTAASWSPAIWAGMRGAVLDVFTGTSSSKADLTVSSVNLDTRTITTGTNTGVLAGDLVFLNGTNSGSGTYTEMAGLQAILQNSGTLFNISAATYELWKGNEISSVGALTFSEIQDAVMKCMSRGLMGDVEVYMSPRAWGVLNSDLSSLNRFNGAGGKWKQGAQDLGFYGANGSIELIAHPFVKDGDVFVLPKEGVIRVGSTATTFKIPGSNDEYFLPVSGKPYVELQAYADESIFMEAPGQGAYLSGVTFA